MSRNGPKGSGVLNCSQPPAKTCVSSRWAATNCRAREVLPMPASPSMETIRPAPARASFKAASNRDLGVSRSRSIVHPTLDAKLSGIPPGEHIGERPLDLSETPPRFLTAASRVVALKLMAQAMTVLFSTDLD